MAQLLLNRGLADADKARRFLEPVLRDLHPPALLPGCAQAADVILSAIQNRQRICVYGDYDVDGITGTAILWQTIHKLGGVADFYVPHRLEEGYGLNCEALARLAQSGVQLVVTVDCGITSVAEAEEARRLGLKLIVTDHHEPKSQFPAADVLVHPRLPGSAYPFDGLSGAGVAFKLAWTLCQRHCNAERVTPAFREFLMECVTLTALGLVADSMPLLDENRVFVHAGLSRIRQAASPGLKALLAASGIGDKPDIRAEDVSFKLAPRLNAAGRLGSARLVLELLTTQSDQRAADLARFLEGQNTQRQQFERKIVAQAREMVEEGGFTGSPALVLAHADWHPGIIGIVGSRLVERFGKPALLIALKSQDGNGRIVGHGSGRSVPGFALHEALVHCGEHLLSHGGHAAAAGFTIDAMQIDHFRERFCQYVNSRHADGFPPACLDIEAEAPLALLTIGLVKDLEHLEPYGMANKRPLFLASELQIAEPPKRVGGGERHLSFRVRQGSSTLRAIAFGMAERAEELVSADGICSLVFTPRINEWNGYRRVDLEVVDFQPGKEVRFGKRD